MTKNNDQISISPLKWLAIQHSEKAIPNEEIRKRNVTEELYEDINHKIKTNELINYQIIGQVVSGKSTEMCELVHHINTKLGKKMSLEQIATDQIDYSRKTQEKKYEKTCVGIDEWNNLSEGGYNSSTEQQYLDWQSNVAAQLFIHRISCSPGHLIDRNADIILEVLAKDIEKERTRNLVYYRIHTANGVLTQLVGYADIDVHQVLKNNWYQQYRKRKMAKLDLIRENAVRDQRDLENAEMVLEIYNQLKELSEVTIISEAQINNTYQQVRRKQKRFHSIFGGVELVKQAKGILDLRTSIRRSERYLLNRTRKLEKENDQKMRKWYEGEVNILRKNLVKQLEGLTQTIQDLEKLIRIYKEYEAI